MPREMKIMPVNPALADSPNAPQLDSICEVLAPLASA